MAGVVFHAGSSAVDSGDLSKEALEQTRITGDVKQRADGEALTSMLLNQSRKPVVG